METTENLKVCFLTEMLLWGHPGGRDLQPKLVACSVALAGHMPAGEGEVHTLNVGTPTT